jgi:hypothetical protein
MIFSIYHVYTFRTHHHQGQQSLLASSCPPQYILEEKEEMDCRRWLSLRLDMVGGVKAISVKNNTALRSTL